MKKGIACFFAWFICSLALAQTNTSILPYSFSYPGTSLNFIARMELPPFDTALAARFDEQDLKNRELPKFSRTIFTDITLNNAGTWSVLPNGDRLWRLQVVSKGAQALLPYFDKFFLPPGAILHFYTADRRELVGAFTSANNPASGYYAAGMIHGESFIMEYYEPEGKQGEGYFSLNEIGHAYRWVNKYFPASFKDQNDTLGFNQSNGCQVNVNCSEGADWQNQKRAVVCIVVKSTFGQGICSGVLLNNTREDCTPYLLSAQHCSAGANSNQLNQWLFYFNYESPQCTNPLAIGTLDNSFVSGCSKIADSNDSGGDTGSDFLLLQLNNTPPTSYNIFYAGWNVSNSASTSGVSIHHPEGDIKKISSYNQTLINDSWGGSVTGTHWSVRWSSTSNGFGVTESGSSGAPLFNETKQVIGKLTGGSSSCSLPNARDLYGKLSFDWVSNGVSATRQLKPWLDPDNIGATSVVGRNADCATGISSPAPTHFTFALYPNPSNTEVNIEFANQEIYTVLLFDVLGKMIYTTTTHQKLVTFSVSNLSKGMYLAVVTNEFGFMEREKFIVE